MAGENARSEMDRLERNLERLAEMDTKQQEVINRLSIIIAGDRDSGTKGLVGRQDISEKSIAKLNELVVGAKAIFWVMGGIGVGGIVVIAKMVSATSELTQHLINLQNLMK